MTRTRFPWGLFLLGLLAVVLLPGGAAVLVAVTMEQRKVRAALRAAAVRFGLEPDYVDAIARVENRWRLSGTNLTGADGARGGAWGPTQITERTARALGYQGAMADLNRSPELAAEWTARILADAHRRRPLTTLADYVAAWNAGRDDADRNNNNDLEELGATFVTRVDYLPKAKRALEEVRGTPVVLT